jgi:protein-L-isoaspartate(D-aspartate) O-methyltransferase
VAYADRPAMLRSFFAHYVTTKGDARDSRIRDTFAAVPREAYAGPGPWSVHVPGRGSIVTPTDDIAFLYQDTLIAIDVARGINIGEPSLHARCLDALQIRTGETVLHVGAGVGYYTALLADLVGSTGRVLGLEIEPDLAERAAANLAHIPWVEVASRSGLAPNLPTSTVIYVNAGLPDVPAFWRQALRPGGRLLFPFQPVGGFGAMLRIERPENDVIWPARFVTRAGFIGCVGGQEQTASLRVAGAFQAGGWEEVRSLRFDQDMPPDESCWLRGDGWWLSRSAPKQAAGA